MKSSARNDVTMQSAAPTLRELQMKLSAVVNGSASSSDLAQVESWIDLADKNMTATDRIEVYSDAWFMRIEESLAEDFPRFRETLDDDEWEILVRNYLKAYPSSSYTLARTGDQLPGFLAEQKNIETWQADLTLLEKALYKSSSAFDIKAWDVSELEKMDPEEAENLKFDIQPAFHLIHSDWNILELQESIDATPLKQESFTLVYREGFTVETRALPPNEWQFLKSIGNGATLSQLIEEFPDNAWLPFLVAAASSGMILPVLNSPSDTSKI